MHKIQVNIKAMKNKQATPIETSHKKTDDDDGL